jgi:hypothetical protein
MDITKSTEEIENPTKERTVELIRITEKVDNISEVQATEYKKDTDEGHVSVEEVAGVQGVTVTFQKLVIARKGKYCGLFNLKHQKLYFESTGSTGRYHHHPSGKRK